MEGKKYIFDLETFAKTLQNEVTGFIDWKWNIIEDQYNQKNLFFSSNQNPKYDNKEKVIEFQTKFFVCERIKEKGLIERATTQQGDILGEVQTIKLESEEDEKKIINQLNIMGKLAKQKQLKIISKLNGMSIIDNTCQFYYNSGLYSLSQPLLQGIVYKEAEILSLIKQIANVMQIAENIGVSHQSLSTLSITYDPFNNNFVLGNWQNACQVEFPNKYIKTNFVGSLIYCSSEMYDGKDNQFIHYSPFKGDVFSLGLIGLRMCGIDDEKILEAKKSKEWNQANFYQLFKSVEKTHGKLIKLLAQMLNRNSALRPSWITICELLQDVNEVKVAEENFQTQYLLSYISYHINGCNLAIMEQNYQACQEISERALSLLNDNESILTEQMKEFQIQLAFLRGLGYLKQTSADRQIEQFKEVQIFADSFIEKYGKKLKIYPFIFKRLASIYYSNHEIEKALEHYNLAIENLKKVFNESNIEIAKIYHEIGLILMKEENFEQAANTLQQGIQMWKSIYGEKDLPLSTFYNSISLCFKFLANYEESLTNLELSLQIISNGFGKESKQAQIRLNNIALILKLMNNEEEAIEKLKELIKIKEINQEEEEMHSPEQLLEKLNFIEENIDHPDLDIMFVTQTQQSKFNGFTLKGPELKPKPKKKRVKKVVEEEQQE